MADFKINPTSRAMIVTPSDTVPLASGGVNIVTRGIRLTSAGKVTVLMAGDAATGTSAKITYPSGALTPGILHAMQIVQVFATNTDSNTIIVEWGD